MPTTTIPNLALSGPDLDAIAAAMTEGPWAAVFGGTPDSLDVDNAPRTPGERPLASWFAGADKVQARWGKGSSRRTLVLQRKHGVVMASLPVWPVEIDAVLDLLTAVPFELASFTSIHDEWAEADYDAPSFGGGHYAHGWACAFRGAGHDRLTSARWLDHGPWLVHRRGDVSLVQFHDLAAAPQVALEQARAGHRRMGWDDHGGFLVEPYPYKHPIAGVYLAKLRHQRIIVVDRDVAQREMLDACAVKRDKRTDAEKPIEQVGFVFLERARAERHLHALWLRGLECWTNEGGREVRLDEGYTPPPIEPPWT